MFMDLTATPSVLHAPATHQGLPTRLDAGAILKRFHFLEEALVRACAGWITSVYAIETKALLARLSWESALTGDALRERVFELRFPSRLMEVGDDRGLVTLFRSAAAAPSAVAFLEGLSGGFLPVLLAAQRDYLADADALADGPTRRFLELSVAEKQRAIADIAAVLADERDARGDRPAPAIEGWGAAVAEALAPFSDGGLAAQHPVTAAAALGQSAYAVPSDPARDARYFACRFYWPDTLDPSYAYGAGIRLQLRSAVSHLNEVWAVEVAGAALFELSDTLGWEFTVDAARWTYDEARHMLMGQRRIAAWGLASGDVPLGRYIYDASASGSDPIYRIGMLGFFETKNISKKMTRAREFGAMGDAFSERDMQFDWADETIHAEYGRRWLKQLLTTQGRPPEDYSRILEECEALVREQIAGARDGELAALRACAERLVGDAERLAASGE